MNLRALRHCPRIRYLWSRWAYFSSLPDASSDFFYSQHSHGSILNDVVVSALRLSHVCAFEKFELRCACIMYCTDMAADSASRSRVTGACEENHSAQSAARGGGGAEAGRAVPPSCFSIIILLTAERCCCTTEEKAGAGRRPTPAQSFDHGNSVADSLSYHGTLYFITITSRFCAIGPVEPPPPPRRRASTRAIIS